jgi:3',5'-cyclic AMP phosphodiesterase CpdA
MDMTGPETMPGLGRYLFSIAVIADTHMNEDEHSSASPYECNRVANARTRWVIQRINQLRPELTIHLGDLVHPVPTQPTFAQAARNFKQLTSELRTPLYLVAGNHDVGDKPVVWAPAGTVNEATLALWKEHFGRHYYSFDFRDLHFLVIDAQIINSGLAEELEQRTWLERDLAANGGKRTFLCIHYPPYVSDPEESESYDNLGEPGRSWLLGLIDAYRPEAMFCGHVHNFWYNRFGATECYVLPSTAFVRQDYSELYRVEPGDEHGRNDVPKLGFFLVRIYERGHVCEVIRTYGATLDPGHTMAPAEERVAPLHLKENGRAPLGVDMRHAWAEVIEIPPMGALDEFERKKVRNDYPLMALWEMGIRKLRVPFQDLEDPRVRERMRLLRSLGHEFTVYTLDVPQGRACDLLIEYHELVDAWEVVCSWPDVERTVAAIHDVKAKAPLAAYLSKLRSKEDVQREGSRYYHFVNHGFVVGERDAVEKLLRSSGTARVIDGVVFRVARQASPWREIAAAADLTADLRFRATCHIRMTSTNPAEDFTDDLANANRVAEALLAALAQGAPDRNLLDVFIDTFADIDRGYFVRNGLVDRRYNPRLGSHVVRNLYGALNAGGGPVRRGGVHEVPSARICTVELGGEVVALVLPQQKARVDRVPADGSAAGPGGTARCADLETGRITRTPWKRVGEQLELEGGRACMVPTLIWFGA